MSYLESVDPWTGTVLERYQEHSMTEVNAIIRQAEARFKQWRQTGFKERSDKLLRVAQLLKAHSGMYARVIMREMGKPISQAKAEVEKCAWVCEYYAHNAQKQLSPAVCKTDARKSYVSYEPLGVVLAVMPWNYPFWQVFRFAAPALMAGNVCLLKHASNVSGSAIAMEQLFLEAGFPQCCFNTLVISSSKVEAAIDHKYVRAATLTGSEKAGSAVAGAAGRNLKKTVLELGGNNALIVLPDCNLEMSVETCVRARFQNNGQSCIAGKRLLIQRSIATAFLQKLQKKVEGLTRGKPENKDTYISCMAREDLARELEEQLQSSLDKGARILCGGSRDGAYFEPTLVTDVKPGMPLFDQETFGPVLAITVFDSLDEAIELSNRSKYGLGVSVFTTDEARILGRVADFHEGAVFINELVKSDPRLPFGGVKASGYGRELSDHGIREFTNVKTVYVK